MAIALPPGRNGFQPRLNLIYSNGNGNGLFGLGLEVRIEHRWPRYSVSLIADSAKGGRILIKQRLTYRGPFILLPPHPVSAVRDQSPASNPATGLDQIFEASVWRDVTMQNLAER